MSDDEEYMKKLVDNGLEMKVVGILRPNEDASAASISGTVAYTSALTEYVIDNINESKIAKAQLAAPETDIFTGTPFDMENYLDDISMDTIHAYLETLPENEKAQFEMMTAEMTEEQILQLFKQQMENNQSKDTSTYEENLQILGIVNKDEPSVIDIYPVDFEAKDSIVQIIEDYNDEKVNTGEDEKVISYTDMVGLMMSSVTSIINMISYILIGFVAISLVVSSIMIGIITYISVLERTKEIGVLRSIGASKRNVSSIFNAETFIEGFISGIIGIGITLLLLIPANIIIEKLSGAANIASLPWAGGIALIAVSIILTLIAGIIPSKKAAKQDPVAALRSE